MKLSYFDIILERITEKDKELIRYWRNHERIKSKMEFRDYVTPEMHDTWFKSINDFNHAFCFMIFVEQFPVGIIYGRNTDQLYSEGGMFIWDDKYIGTQFPVLVSIMMTDINFYFLKQREAYIKILRDNFNAIHYNRWFGYKLCNEEDPSYNQRYVLTEGEYRLQSVKVKKLISSYYQTTSTIKIIIEEIDLKNGLYDYLKKYVKDMNTPYPLFELVFEQQCP